MLIKTGMCRQVTKILLLFLFSSLIFDVGVFFGGGEQLDTANSINSIIAIGTALSACATLGTLVLLIKFRDDWKAPKIDESRLKLITDIRRWERFYLLYLETPSKFIKQSNDYNKLHVKFSKEIEVEELYWTNLEASFDTLIYYEPLLKKLDIKFKELSEIRYEIIESVNNLNQRFGNFQLQMGSQEISHHSMSLSIKKHKNNRLKKLSESIVNGI